MRNKETRIAKAKTLVEQMLEYSKRTEKIEQLTKDLIVNPEWKIIEDGGEFYAVDMYGQEHLINVELREKFPNSYFHSPECDRCIIGYDSFSGSIIYNLWVVGKIEMEVSEGILSDFHDTGYGIGRLLRSTEEYGFDGKVPPGHILPQDFIYHQNDLHGSLDNWGYDVPLVKANISETEQRQLHLYSQIRFNERFLEDTTDKSDDFRNTYRKELDNLIIEFDAIGDVKYADLKTFGYDREITLEAQMEKHYKLKKLSKELCDPGWYVSELYGEYYASQDYPIEDCPYEYHINMELREKLPNSFFHFAVCDDSIVGYDAQSGAIIYDLWKAAQRLKRCVDNNNPAYADTVYAIGLLLSQLEESGLDSKAPPAYILPPNFINHTIDLRDPICYSNDGLPLFNYNGLKEHYRKALKGSIDCFQTTLKDQEGRGLEYAENLRKQREVLTKPF